jgi:hypothetical protein
MGLSRLEKRENATDKQRRAYHVIAIAKERYKDGEQGKAVALRRVVASPKKCQNGRESLTLTCHLEIRGALRQETYNASARWYIARVAFMT